MKTDEVRQFDRYCKDCRQSLRGVESRRCPECGRAFDPGDPRTTSAGRKDVTRRQLQKVHQFGMSLGVLVAVFAFLSSIAGADPLFLWVFGVLGFIVWGPLVGAMIVYVFLPGTNASRSYRLATLLLPILILSIVLTYWPMWIPFWLHKSAFETVADQFESGSIAPPPTQIGLYPILRIRQSNGSTGFQVSGGSGGGKYLVRRSGASPPGWVWTNTNWEIYLGDDWYYVYED